MNKNRTATLTRQTQFPWGACLVLGALLGGAPDAANGQGTICPLPATMEPVCATLQGVDCDTGVAGDECFPLSLTVDSSGGVVANQCTCASFGATCGPIGVNNIGAPGIAFRCLAPCPSGNCFIHLDGVSTGADNILASAVLPGQTVTCECTLPCDQSAYPACTGDCTDAALTCQPDSATQTCACAPPVTACPLPPAPTPQLCAGLQSTQCQNPLDPADQCLPNGVTQNADGTLGATSCSCGQIGSTCGPVNVIVDVNGVPQNLSCEAACPDPANQCLIHRNGTSTGSAIIGVDSVGPGDVITCQCTPPPTTYQNWVIADDFCVECPCDCDLNGDGACNLFDIVVFQGCFSAGNPLSSQCRKADLNCDGKINALDVSIFIDLYQGVPPEIACQDAVRPVVDHLRWYGSWIDPDFEPLTGGTRMVDGWLVALHSDLPAQACPPLSNAAAKPFDFCCTLETCATGTGFVCRPKGSSFTYNLVDINGLLLGNLPGDMVRICGEVIPFDPGVCDTSIANVQVNGVMECASAVSRPDRLIAQWAFNPADVSAELAPTATGLPKVGCDSHPIWCYDADLPDACLIHDFRAPDEIGANGVFLPRPNRTYWISFQAEVGHAVNKTINPGVCSNDSTIACTADADCFPIPGLCSNAPVSCGADSDCPSGGTCGGQPICLTSPTCSFDPVSNPATQDFWGWHTTPPGYQHKDDAYMGELFMGTPNEPCADAWFYDWMGHLHCSDPGFTQCCDDPTRSIDMAFYLIDRKRGFCQGTTIPCSNDADCDVAAGVLCVGGTDLIHWCQPVNPGPPPPQTPPPFTPVPPLTPVPSGTIDEMPDTEATMVVQFLGNPNPEPPIQMQGPTVVSRGNLVRRIDRGDCSVAGSTLQFCDPAGVACTTSGGLPGTCTQQPGGCECVASDAPPANRTIDTEILSMDLRSVDPMNPVNVRAGQSFGLPPSPGQVDGLPSSDFQVDSFFDVFVEIEIVQLNLTLHNQAPIRVQAQISEVPPGNTTYRGPLGGPVDLFDPFGQPVAQLLDISHFLPYKGGIDIHSDVDWLSASSAPCCEPDPTSFTGCSQTQCPVDTETCLPTCIQDTGIGNPTVIACDCLDETQTCHATIDAAGMVSCTGGCPTANKTCVGPFLADVNGDGVVDGWKCECQPVETGACCEQVAGANLTCTDNVTAANCNGSFFANGSCLGVQACCDPTTGTCSDIDVLCCHDLGGIAQGPGTTCATPGICGGGFCPLPPVYPWCDIRQPIDCPSSIPGETCLLDNFHFDVQGQPVIDGCACFPQTDECGPVQLLPNPTPPGGFRVSCKAVCPPGQNCLIHFDDGTGPVSQGVDVMDSSAIPPDVSISCQCVSQELGACCFDGPAGPVCQDNVTQAQCDNVAGAFSANQTCQGTESCCLPDGTCLNVDALCCAGLGGTPGGPGSACKGQQACCDPLSGGCTDEDASCCQAHGGIPQGSGTDCTNINICNPPLCPVPASKPWCANLQGNDCAASSGNTNCLPSTVAIDPPTGSLVIDSCNCFVSGECGPVTIVEQPGVFPPYIFICEKSCPDPNDTCEVHIDGVPQGVVSLGSNWVPNGQIVSCGCVPPETPCPLPGGDILPLCQANQAAECTSPNLTSDECLPTVVTLAADGTLVGAKCKCLTQGDKCGPVQAISTPTGVVLSCEGQCPDPTSQQCLIHRNGVSAGVVSIDASSVGPTDVITCDCEPPSTGACCSMDAAGVITCQDGLSQMECDALFGVFHVNESCLGKVACCRPDGTCADVDRLCCEDFGGVPQPAGSDCTQANICNPPMCPLPLGVNWCAARQAIDCPTSGGNTQCRPFKVTVDANEILDVQQCDCSPGGCGPITIVENPPGMPPYTFVCEKNCPNPDDTCEVHLDGVPQGTVSILSNGVAPGQVVSCGCVSPPSLCEDGPYPACGGTCPPGRLCKPNVLTQMCRCVLKVDPVLATDKTYQRALEMVIPASSAGANTAYRVTLLSLYHPGDPQPANQPDYSARQGEVRYLNLYRDANGVPVTQCLSSLAFGTTYPCVSVGCQPEFADWGTLFGGRTVYAMGNAIIPDSAYTVAHLAPSCAGNEATCTDASAEVGFTTARFGDSQPDGTVNVADVVNVVDVVKQSATALLEYHVYVRDIDPAPHLRAVNVQDIVAHVDALKLASYTLPVNACP